MANPRTWRDGDTYLVLAMLVLVCGMAIVRHGLSPDNWISLDDGQGAPTAASAIEARPAPSP